MKKFTSLLALLLVFAGAMHVRAQVLDRSGWTVTASSDVSEGGTNGYIPCAIDGDISTYWHSYWSGGSGHGYTSEVSLPQFICIDLGSEQTFQTVGYIPRPKPTTTTFGNGTVTEWSLYVSSTPFGSTADGTTTPSSIIESAGTAALTGSWTWDTSFDPSTQIMTKSADSPMTGRYVLFVVTGSNNSTHASCAELFLGTGTSMDYPSITTVERKATIDTNKYLSVGEKATSIQVSTDTEEHWYALWNNGRSCYVQENGVGASLKMRANETADLVNKLATEARQQYLFKFTSVGEGRYKVISAMGTSFTIGYNSSSCVQQRSLSNSVPTYTIAQIGDNAGYFSLLDESTGYYANGQDAGNNFVGWSTDAPTSTGANASYSFIPVTLLDENPSYILSDISNDKVYTIAGARGAFTYDAAVSTTNITASVMTGVTEAANGNFAILTSGSNKYLYSIGASKFVSPATTASNQATTKITTAPVTTGFTLVENEANNANYPYLVKFDGVSFGISTGFSSEGKNMIIFWNSATDEGNQVRLTQVTDAEFDNAIPMARIALYEGIASCQSTYTFGTTYGTYASSDAYTSALSAAQTALEKADATEAELKSALTTLQSAAAALTFNTPADGAFIRIKGFNATNHYLACTSSTDANHADFVSDNTGDNTIFCWKDGKLVSYNTGYKLNNRSGFVNWNGTSGDAEVSFTKSTLTGAGKFFVTFKNGSATRYLYAGDNSSNAGNSVGSDTKYTFDIEAVETLPVSITSAGYATLYAPQALTIPTEGVEAYTPAFDAEGGKAVLNAVTGTIPANTGVVLKGNEGTYNFTVTTSTTEGTSELTGNIPTTTIGTDETIYILALNAAGTSVGFYPMTSTTDRAIHGFRAYYAPGSTTAAGFAFTFDGQTTGINAAADTTTGADRIFDLSGRRVQKTTKGFYIVNGKKVLVK